MTEQIGQGRIIEGRPVSDWITLQRTAVTEALGETKKIKTKSPLVDQLRAESLVIADKLDGLKKPAGMPGSIADLVLAEADETHLRGWQEDILHQINGQTEYFAELRDTEIAPALLLGKLEKGRYRANVKWLTPDRRIFAGMEADTAGDYWMRTDVVRIAGSPPSPKELLKSLLTQGTLPETIATLDHELTHNEQYRKFILLYWLKNDIFPDDFLTEAHAYAAELSAASTLQPDLDESDEIIDHIFDNYGESHHRPRRTALQAFNQLQTLRILGYDDTAIGAIVSEAQYDPKTKRYPLLVAEVRQAFEAQNLTQSNEQIAVLKGLKALHNVNLHFQRKEACRIACQTLTPMFRNRSWGSILS